MYLFWELVSWGAFIIGSSWKNELMGGAQSGTLFVVGFSDVLCDGSLVDRF